MKWFSRSLGVLGLALALMAPAFAQAQTVTVTNGEFSSCAVEYTNVAGGNLLQATLGQTFATIDPQMSGGPDQPIVSAGFAETAVRYRYHGTLALLDYLGTFTPLSAVPLEVRVWTGSEFVLETVSPDDAGNFIVDSWANATFVTAISAKGVKWLRDSQAVSLPANPAANVTFATLNLIPGDMTNDNVIDLFDLVKLFDHYGSEAGDAEWGEGIADLNGDGVVDLFDLVVLFKYYGEEGGE